ncbi:MAG: FAD-dependent oxidoreductase [Betaproteobacteria bacterium]
MKKLVLLGGGHAHVHVLKALAETPLAGVEVTLISPYARQVYSGMLPGWVAGHYTIGQCVIPLPPLCRAAGATFIETAGRHLDFPRRVVQCGNGAEIGFDVLSIDTGPMANTAVIPGAGGYAVAVRPIESFIDAFAMLQRDITARANAGQATDVVFVGAGAAGIELALSMQVAFRDQHVSFTLVSAANTLPGSVGPRLARILAQRGFRVLAGKSAGRIERGRVHLQSGETLNADHVIVSTGAIAAEWPHASGLQTDAAGFILVNEHLQSVSHPDVFAAGDCATMVGHARPKSGVYAVRAGPPLAENLRRRLGGVALRGYVPQAWSLYLISTGDRYAIGSWGKFAWEGKWVWRWKDRIDRAFMAKYSLPES